MPRRSGVSHRRLLADLTLAALVVAACGGEVRPSPTPPAATPPPSVAPSPSPSPTPEPPAVLDPLMTGDQLFDDQATAAQLDVVERSRAARGAAIVRDIRFEGADGHDVAAYLVGPAQGTPTGGVLFLHWLGADFSSREEFLTEAVALSGHGVESLLITQRFPWSEQPAGVEHDRVAIGLQVRDTRRALTVLAEQVGPAKIALVGHDYGAMYAILAASSDPRVAALVGMAPDATWVNWFVTYFDVDPQDGGGYAQAMADLDPATRIETVTAPILLQFGITDTFVSADAVGALTDGAPGGTTVHRYDAGHRLDDRARDDRDAWLLQQLGIAARP